MSIDFRLRRKAFRTQFALSERTYLFRRYPGKTSSGHNLLLLYWFIIPVMFCGHGQNSLRVFLQIRTKYPSIYIKSLNLSPYIFICLFEHLRYLKNMGIRQNMSICESAATWCICSDSRMTAGALQIAAPILIFDRSPDYSSCP